MTDESANQSTSDPCWTDRQNLIYDIRLSALYHQKRARFFDLVDKVCSSVAIFGGASAFAAVAKPEIVQWLGATIALTSTANLVADVPGKSRRHSELVAAFRALEAEIERKGPLEFQRADLNEWAAKRAALEASEPAALTVLVAICQNELARALDQKNKIVPLPWFKKCLAQWLDFELPAH